MVPGAPRESVHCCPLDIYGLALRTLQGWHHLLCLLCAPRAETQSQQELYVLSAGSLVAQQTVSACCVPHTVLGWRNSEKADQDLWPRGAMSPPEPPVQCKLRQAFGMNE